MIISHRLWLCPKPPHDYYVQMYILYGNNKTVWSGVIWTYFEQSWGGLGHSPNLTVNTLDSSHWEHDSPLSDSEGTKVTQIPFQLKMNFAPYTLHPSPWQIHHTDKKQDLFSFSFHSLKSTSPSRRVCARVCVCKCILPSFSVTVPALVTVWFDHILFRTDHIRKWCPELFGLLQFLLNLNHLQTEEQTDR